MAAPSSQSSTSDPALKRWRRWILPSALAVLAIALWDASLAWGLPGFLLRAYAVTFLCIFLLRFLGALLRRFLWRVGRRLAFSYFLFGIVPLVLGVVLVIVLAYTLSGYFVGHVFRDTMGSVSTDLRVVARRQLEQWRLSHLPTEEQKLPIAVAFYRNGKKVNGDPEAPREWQLWWPAERLDAGEQELDDMALLQGPDGQPQAMVAVFDGRWGVTARWQGDLAQELADRSGIWVDIEGSDAQEGGGSDRITAFNREFSFGRERRSIPKDEVAKILHPGVDSPGWLDRPSVRWVEIWRPYYLLDTDGEEGYVYTELVSNLRGIYYRLLSSSAEIDSRVVVTLAIVAFVLFDIYILAALMAALMVAGLSRAVNRLTTATQSMQAGDFGIRIAVERRDQIGALQESFNQMASNLQGLIAEAAQKEVLEKDLAFARELQQSLLPDTLATPPSLRFATHFEPSSAIGGDYYDLLPMGGQKLAVMVADAAGHGTAAGLRMAMVKSALQVLAAQQQDPLVILRQLHQLLRRNLAQRRSFVTASLCVIDGTSGELILTNAGHPPTYIVRQGQVTAIELPSLPLGTFADRFARRTFRLQPGDSVVWMSDGLIEATNSRQEALGYEAIEAVLTDVDNDPEAIRTRLLEAVDHHTGDFPPHDDRTLLVMRFQPPEAEAEDDEDSTPDVG